MKNKWVRKIGVIATFTAFAMMAIGSGSTDAAKENKQIVGTDTEQSVQDEQEGIAEETGKGASIEEQILLEQDGIKITATGMEEDSIWGEGVKLLIENNTEKNIGVGCNALIVNDYMITDLFSTSVAAGKKANEVMYMSSTELEAAGISNIGQIEIYFHIYDGDNFETILDADRVVIQTSQYENMDTENSQDGKELYNQDGIRIVGKYVDEGSFWGTAVLLYIENTSGRNIGVGCDDMSINGFMVTPYFSCTVYDGKKALDDITIMSSDLEQNGIESVDELEVNFHIYDVDSYETITDTGAITFSAK